jgi:hypothetical protein
MTSARLPSPPSKTEPKLPRTSSRTIRRSPLAASALLLAATTGCSDEATIMTVAPSTGPLYAIMYEVYDQDGSTSYLSVLGSLDEEIDLSAAREYGRGRAFIQGYNGWLFVGDSETPTVTRYSLAEDGALVQEDTMSFANYGLREGQFDSWNATFISPEKAYLFDFVEGNTIIWNPTTMEITGEIPGPAEFLRPDLRSEGSPAALRDGLLFRTFDWVDDDTAEYSSDFLLAVYDVETDELIDLQEETRCPVPGNLVDTDEAGNIYFSNWIWPVAGTLMREAPPSCVLRIAPGEARFDPEWTLDYPDYTEGRAGAMFAYLQDGQGLVSAFYDENTSFDDETDPWSYVGSNNWRIWSIDLESGDGAPLDGLDFNGGAFTPIQFDDRLFLMVPGGEEDDYATQVFEVVDGSAVPYVQLPGWSYQFVKLR